MTSAAMTGRRDALDAGAVSLLVCLCALWGVQQVAIKVASAGISPIMQGGVRSLGSALLVWGWSAWRGVPLFTRDGSLWPGLAAGGLFAGEFVLLYEGLTRTTAAHGVLFLYSAPFFVALGAHLFIPGERIRRRQAGGLLCAFAGLAVAFGDALQVPTAQQSLGDLLTLGAAVLWAATTVLIKSSRRLATTSANKLLLYQLGTSAVMLPPLALLLGEPGFTDPTPAVLIAFAYQIVVVAFASYLVWFWLITRYPASRLSVFTFLTPLFGLLAGWALLGEPITPALIGAMGLVCVGLVLVNWPGRGSP